MIDLGQIVDLITKAASLLQEHAPETGVTFLWLGLVCIGLGAIVGSCGAKMLRFLFVAAFLGVGGAIGIHLARRYETDLLIGLVLGAGVVALIGHLTYRWWVAISAGLLAMAAIGWLNGHEAWPKAIRDFEAQRPRIVAADAWLDQPTADAQEAAVASLKAQGNEIVSWMWENRRGLVTRSSVVCGAAFLFGFGLGLVFPRSTTIAGTSIVGVSVMLIGGAAVVIAVNRTHWLEMVKEYPRLTWGVIAGLLVAAIMIQTAWIRVPIVSEGKKEPAGA